MASEVPEAPRKVPRQARARATVDAIVVAAAHILKTEGFERATTNRIAELAGVSIGSLYQYFPNKHAVLAELRARHADWFNGSLAAEIERIRGAPLREAMRSAVELSIALHATDPALHNALSPPGRPVLDPEEEARYRAMVRAFLERRAAELRPCDAEQASFIAVRALEALVHGTALDEPERLRDPAFADELTELVVRYLERREGD